MGASPTGNSYLSTFKRCPRKFYYQHVRGLETRHLAAPLCIGTLVHEGLAVLPQKGISGALAQLLITAEEEGFQESEYCEEWISMAAKLLEGYAETYSNDPFTPLIEEHEFSFTIPDTNFKYTGKMDKIVRGPGGKLYVMEHKTTGLAPSMYLRTFYNDPQISGYYLGAREALRSLGGEGIVGVVLDILTKPRKTKAGWGKHEYVREVFTRDEEQLRDFLLSTKEVFSHIQACILKGKESFYKCENECFSFGKPCPYLDLCRYGENKALIEREFNIREA